MCWLFEVGKLGVGMAFAIIKAVSGGTSTSFLPWNARVITLIFFNISCELNSRISSKWRFQPSFEIGYFVAHENKWFTKSGCLLVKSLGNKITTNGLFLTKVLGNLLAILRARIVSFIFFWSDSVEFANIIDAFWPKHHLVPFEQRTVFTTFWE